MDDLLSIQSPPSLFKTHYSLAIRIWHWITFATITASIIMVLLASTLFTTKGNVKMVQQMAQQKGSVLTPDQAKFIAHEYSDKLWNLHKYLGFALSFLFFSRLLIEISCSKEQQLFTKIQKASTLKIKTRRQEYDKNHYQLVKWVYVVFYGLLLVMVLTGLGLAFEDIYFFRNIHQPLAGIHSFAQYPIYFYILIHIIGVVKADVTDNRGIVSAMINGGDKTV